MTDTRQVLEEAFDVVFPVPGITASNERRCKWQEDFDKFFRFLDAEAWTDAALCLVPEEWEWAYLDNAAIVREAGTLKHAYGNAPVPALAIAQAALRAQEAGDV